MSFRYQCAEYLTYSFVWMCIRHIISIRYNLTIKVYSKQIRNRIPKIIQKDRNTADIIILSEAEFKQVIKEKLIEEATEECNAQERDDILIELVEL